MPHLCCARSVASCVCVCVCVCPHLPRSGIEGPSYCLYLYFQYRVILHRQYTQTQSLLYGCLMSHAREHLYRSCFSWRVVVMYISLGCDEKRVRVPHHLMLGRQHTQRPTDTCDLARQDTLTREDALGPARSSKARARCTVSHEL